MRNPFIRSARRLFAAGVVAFAACVGASPAQAGLVNFNATGVPGISGYIEVDDSTFSGVAVDLVSNTQITAFSLTVFGQVFTLADVFLDRSRLSTATLRSRTSSMPPTIWPTTVSRSSGWYPTMPAVSSMVTRTCRSASTAPSSASLPPTTSYGPSGRSPVATPMPFRHLALWPCWASA